MRSSSHVLPVLAAGVIALGSVTATSNAAQSPRSGTTSVAAPAAGHLDPSFSGDGQRTLRFDSARAGATAVAMQGRRILLGGSASSVPGRRDFALARFTASGTLDPSFGIGGRVRTRLATDADSDLASLAVLPNGKILATGESRIAGRSRLSAVRYLADGGVDHAFGGGDGIAFASYGRGPSYAAQGILLANGRFLICGSTASRFAVARFRADGSLDPAFGGDGTVVTDFPERSASCEGLATDSRGRVVAVGSTTKGQVIGPAVVRYLPGGRLDRSFSGDGRTSFSFGPMDPTMANDVVVTPRGRIVLAWTGGRLGVVTVARLLSNGKPDLAFGSGHGRVDEWLGPGSGESALVRQPDGRLLLVGDDGFDPPFVIRYTANGKRDPSFGADGFVDTPSRRGAADAGAATLQDDGKLVVGGHVSIDSSPGEVFFAERVIT